VDDRLAELAADLAAQKELNLSLAAKFAICVETITRQADEIAALKIAAANRVCWYQQRRLAGANRCDQALQIVPCVVRG